MKGRFHFEYDYAVSEVVGGILLVLIAVAVFSVIYLNVTSKDMGIDNTNVEICGSVNDEGIIVLEHISGDVIDNYRVVVSHPNGTEIGSKTFTDDWAIGEYRYPLTNITDMKLVNETLSLTVAVYTENSKGDEKEIFKADLFGKVSSTYSDTPSEPGFDPEIPLLISSLRSNTVDEDLICYSLSTNVNLTPVPSFFDWDVDMDWQVDNDDRDLVDLSYGLTGSPGWIREDVNNDGIISDLDEDIVVSHYGETQLTYIYNWMVNDDTITNLLMPFNSNNLSVSKDYSGSEKHGTIDSATWSSSGVVGGCYQFDGDDHISLPYCFDEDYIDDITVEAWVKTNDDDMTVASFDREKYWGIQIVDGCVQWSTAVRGEETIDVNGITSVNDNSWHYIATSYDSSSGDCSIYVDGKLDKNENCHNAGDQVGSGDAPNGYIGASNGSLNPGSWDLLTYDDFESGFGNYQDGGRDCLLYTDSTYAHQGSNAANIRDNSGWSSSFYHDDSIDVSTPGYTSIMVDFWFIANGMESWEDFKVWYYDGSNWREVAHYDCGDEFVNGQYYHEIVWINESDYNFPSNMKILFECSASGNSDNIYIDQVYVNATTGIIVLDDFSGYLDEFHIYNRVLSDDQIYQNYLCMNYEFCDINVIVSEETSIGDVWKCIMTPNDITQDGEPVESNSLQVGVYTGG